MNSECETSRLCFRAAAPTAAGDDAEPDSEAASFSADWTLLSSGERGGSALLGRDIWRPSGGEECSLTGKAGPAAWPGRGDGERCGELPCGVGDGVRASGDSGMLPADLRRGERYWRCSLGARPCSELGRMWPEPAGELGTLEPGELLWDEFPPTETGSGAVRGEPSTGPRLCADDSPEWAESGVDLWPCVGLRGDRL